MKVIADFRGERILLKNYKSYLELDKDFLSFKSKEDLLVKLGLEPNIDDIYIIDNNDKEIDFDYQIIRTTLGFYEQKKCDEFTRWIFNSACDNYHNKNKLFAFFNDRLIKLNNEINENNTNDQLELIKKKTKDVKDSLIMFGYSTGMLRQGRNEVLKNLEEYLKTDNKYSYASMRKMSSSLKNKYSYNFNSTILKDDIDLERQSKVIKEYKTSIHNYVYNKKQITIEKLTKTGIEPNSTYDENGIKIDEKEFLEEFNKKKLHL